MGIRENPVVNLWSKLWEYSEGNRHKVVLYVILFIVANSVLLLEPLVIAYALNTVQEQGITNESLPGLIGTLSLLIVITLVFWSMHGPARVMERRNAFLVRASLKKYLLEGTLALPMSWHTHHHSGNTIDKVEKASRALYEFAEDSFTTIAAVIKYVGAYIALAYFNPHSSYIIALSTIVTVTIILKFDKVLVKQYRKLNKAENTISEKIFDVLSNITTIIILRLERLVGKSIYHKIMQPYGLYKDNTRINEIKWFIVSVCNVVMQFLVLATYIYSAIKSQNAVMIGTLFALYGYLDRVIGLFFDFAWRYGDIVRNNTRLNNAQPIIDAFKAKESVKKVHLGKWKELTIRNLKFTYHTKRTELHLDGISMNILNRGRIALIGDSGSGKTTFLKVVRELYNPKEASVFVDGKELPEGFKNISHDIALIPQEPELFATTIRENITLGVDYKDSHLKRFTDLANFTEVVQRLPKKLDSYIFEKGVNLSGGEKQRLALTRGLLACEDKSIILLDEPTSSVDLRNETQIYHNIFKKYKDKTIIATVHRLHLLPMFDKVYYFKSGKIIASGSFREMKKNKEFQRLWEKQKTKKKQNL